MNKFPTPAEIDAERTVNVAPYVEKTLAAIRADLVKNGNNAAVSIDYAPPGAREEITRILGESGWSAKFDSDQRDGAYVRVTRKG